MANHKWDNPKNKIFATCLKCGVTRFAISKKFGSWEYSLGWKNTFKRPECKKTN